MLAVDDTFTDTSGLALESHTGEVGATWTEHGSYTAGALVISSAGRCRNNVAGNSLYYASGAPAGVEYDVSADFYPVTVATPSIGICGRVDTGADTFYIVEIETTRYRQAKWVASVNTLLGAWTNTPVAGVSEAAKLEIRDATKKTFVNGVERISSTDNAITAAGKAGIRTRNVLQSDSAGMHVDNFQLNDLAAAVSAYPGYYGAGWC